MGEQTLLPDGRAVAALHTPSMGLTGSLPAEWGSPTALQGLQSLSIITSSITGGHGYVAIGLFTAIVLLTGNSPMCCLEPFPCKHTVNAT